MKKIIALLVIIVGLILDGFIYTELMKLENTRKTNSASTAFDIFELELKSTLDNRFFVSEAMSALFKLNPGLSPGDFSAFAETLLSANPAIRAIQYADSETWVRYVYPAVGNEITISNPMNLLSDPDRSKYVTKAIKEKRASLQPPFELRQGGLGMVLRNPIFKGEHFTGLSIIVLDVDKIIEEVYTENEFADFEIGFYREDGSFFFGTDLSKSDSLSRMIPVADTFWEVRMFYTDQPVNYQMIILLLMVFLLAAGIAVILYTLLGQKEYLKKEIEIETARLREANIELNSQIALRTESEEKTSNLLEEKKVLLKEVHHRLKNNLTSISSLLRIQADETDNDTARDCLTGTINRIDSLQRLYKKLLDTEDYLELNAGNYFRDLITSIKETIDYEKQINFVIDNEDLFLDTKILFPLGIIANELVTNAVKHAFPDKAEGTIQVILKDDGNTFTFTVKDNGVCNEAEISRMQDAESSGIGLSLVNILVKQLNGTLKISKDAGCSFAIVIPNKTIAK